MRNAPPSKKLKLKKWVTLSEAAKHLSRVWGEEVTEDDILQFAREGHLKLSVEFVNGTKAVPVISIEEKSTIFPIINTGDVVMNLRGVWDLSMQGAGPCTIERLYRAMKGVPLPDSGIRGFLGFFVTGGGEIYQLVKELSPNEFVARGLEAVPEFPYITESGAVDQAKIEAAIAQLNESWKRFCQDNAAVTLDDPRYYESLIQLPHNSTLVVRSEALREFEQSLDKNEVKQKLHRNTEINAKKREQVLGAALCVLGNWPEQCKNNLGAIEATKMRKLIEEKAPLFWADKGEPPLSTEKVERLIREWLKIGKRN